MLLDESQKEVKHLLEKAERRKPRRTKESYQAPRNSNWPKTTKITFRLSDDVLAKKPPELTITQWVRAAIAEKLEREGK